MKIISSVYSNSQLNKIIDIADGFILMIKPYSVCYGDIDIESAIKLLKSKNKMIILGLNKIYHPNDIDDLNKLLDKYKDDSSIYFYLSDLGACNLCIDKNISNRVIYNPETMITNYLDLSVLQQFKFDAYQMSSEITLEDLGYAYDKTKADLFYYGFGHKIMFYSRRQLLTLYKNKTNIDMPLERGYLKEATREEYMPITENENGTYILRSYVISLLADLDKLEFLKYLFLDSNYIDDDKYFKALKAYNDYNNKNITKNEAIEIINSLDLDIQDGFKNNDTVYLKEELKI